MKRNSTVGKTISASIGITTIGSQRFLTTSEGGARFRSGTFATNLVTLDSISSRIDREYDKIDSTNMVWREVGLGRSDWIRNWAVEA